MRKIMLATRVFSEFIIHALTMVFFLVGQCASAFEISTHESLSSRAIVVSQLDEILKALEGHGAYYSPPSLDFPQGIDQPLNGKTVSAWIVEGSADEDRPFLRSRHHFHDPTKIWTEAGWSPPLLGQLGDSSIIWGQNLGQSFGQHSWHHARDSYFRALTSTNLAEREKLFAETFKTLGHVMHLVQDAASPAHTRNDSHILSDSFHVWPASQFVLNTVIPNMAPIPAEFDISTLNVPSPSSLAPVPIARLIDSTAGHINSLALGPNAGIAEYSNANFYSDDTINATAYQFPRSSQLETRAPEPDASGTRLRRYQYFQPGFGETDYPLALASALSGFHNINIEIPSQSLDDKVLAGYGAKLLPRAISYSAALLKYFFRGQMSANWLLSCTDIMAIVNTDANELLGDGMAVVVFWSAKYQKLYSLPPVAVQTYLDYKTFYVNVPALGLPEDWAFNESNTATDPRSGGIVIFRGRLGEEEDAVAVSDNFGGFYGSCPR